MLIERMFDSFFLEFGGEYEFLFHETAMLTIKLYYKYELESNQRRLLNEMTGNILIIIDYNRMYI